MTTKPDNWDPQPHERQWYSEQMSGDRAYLVRRNGEDMLRLDRPAQEILRPLRHNWKPDVDARPMNLAQLAMVAFAADRELCRALGVNNSGKETWVSLNEAERAAWISGKAFNDGDLHAAQWAIRDGLYDLIRNNLAPLAK